MKTIGKIIIVAVLATLGNFQLFAMDKTPNPLGPKVEDAIISKLVWVSGHWRTSSKGKRYWVRGHWRNVK